MSDKEHQLAMALRYYDYQKAVELLQDEELDFNFYQFGFLSLLMQVIATRDSDLCRLAFSRNDVYVNFQNSQGTTPLMLAISCNNEDAVDAILMKKNLKINLRANDGYTALLISIFNRKDRQKIALKLLARNDVDVNLSDEYGATPLMRACEMAGNEEVVDAILKKKDLKINLQNVNNFSALFLSYFGGKKNMENTMKILSRDDVNLNLRSKNGTTFLMTVISSWDLQTFDVILSTKKFDPNIQDNKGRTALIHIIESNQFEMFEKFLLVEGVDVNLPDKEGNTPLMYAIRHDRKEMFDVLVADERVDRSLENKYGNPALNFAFRWGRSEMEDKLMSLHYDYGFLLLWNCIIYFNRGFLQEEFPPVFYWIRMGILRWFRKMF
jgi:ankyrin repeat protein